MKQKAVSILTTALLIFAVLAVCIGAATLGRDEGKTSHVHSFRTVSTTATCTEGGIRTERCVSCGQERTIADAPLGHTFVDHVCACGERDIVLITFTSTPYGSGYSATRYAEEGMTWQEWVESEYNTVDWYIGEDGRVYIPDELGDDDEVEYNSSPVYGYEEIIPNGQYFFQGTHSGGGN